MNNSFNMMGNKPFLSRSGFYSSQKPMTSFPTAGYFNNPMTPREDTIHSRGLDTFQEVLPGRYSGGFRAPFFSQSNGHAPMHSFPPQLSESYTNNMSYGGFEDMLVEEYVLTDENANNVMEPLSKQAAQEQQVEPKYPSPAKETSRAQKQPVLYSRSSSSFSSQKQMDESQLLSTSIRVFNEDEMDDWDRKYFKKIVKSRSPILLSGTINKVFSWISALKDTSGYLFETVGSLVSVIKGKYDCQKILLLRDKGPVLQCIYYIMDYPFPEFVKGQQIRVVGRWRGGNRLHVFHVREARPGEASLISHLAIMCQRDLDGILKNRN